MWEVQECFKFVSKGHTSHKGLAPLLTTHCRATWPSPMFYKSKGWLLKRRDFFLQKKRWLFPNEMFRIVSNAFLHQKARSEPLPVWCWSQAFQLVSCKSTLENESTKLPNVALHPAKRWTLGTSYYWNPTESLMLESASTQLDKHSDLCLRPFTTSSSAWWSGRNLWLKT